MRKHFYTEAELNTMPLQVLRNLDLDDNNQEALVQKVVNRRLAAMPPSQPVFRKDVPDIETPEQEAHWQEIIDQRTAKLRPQMQDGEPQSDEGLLDPSAPDFDPTKVDLAPKTGEGQPVTMAAPQMSAGGALGRAMQIPGVAERIRAAERITEGTPVTLTNKVASKKTTKKK